MQENLTATPRPQTAEPTTFPNMELGAPTRALIHVIRMLLVQHDWAGYLKALGAHHNLLVRQDRLDDLWTSAEAGDRRALAHILRVELLTVVEDLQGLLGRAEALTAFVTMDEAVAAALAALGDVDRMDAEAVHAVLLGVGLLGAPARLVADPPEHEDAPEPIPEGPTGAADIAPTPVPVEG